MKRTITNPALNESVTLVKTAAETNGTVSELDITLLPDGGNPLSYHTSYTETFTALAGELGLELKKGQKLMVKPGESYRVKIRETHRFLNPGDQPIQFRSEVYPGHEGVEHTRRILSGLATDGLYNDKDVPKSLPHLAIGGILSDRRLPDLMALTTPRLKFTAAQARKNGIEQQLLDRYCRQ